MINKYKIEFYFFNLLVRLFKKIGLEKTRRFAQVFGKFVFYFIPIRKSTVIDNLQIAFPEKSLREIKTIALENYQNITITFFELMLIPFFSQDQIKELVKFENLELVDRIISQKKGVMILSGHFGNWEYITLAFTPHFDAKYNVLVKPQSNPYVTEWLEKTRNISNIEVIPTGLSVVVLYKALLNGEIVGIAGDQRGPYEGKRFLFFDNPTSLYTGSAEIAIRTNCNVILTLFVRQKDFTYKVITEELDLSNLPDDYEAKITEFTQRYISFIEKYVREYPEQYFWMHKIWKY